MKNKTRKRVEEANVPVPLALATSTARRVRGLLMQEPSGQSLLLLPCSDIHTVGMRYPLDVAFVDKEGCVIETHQNVGPSRRLRNRKASAVVERFSSRDAPWFSVGDHVMVSSEKGLK